MCRHPIAICLVASSLSANADPRAWKSADGSKSFQGEFVKWDATTATIRKADGKEITVELSKLHADNRKWLEDFHSLAPPADDPAAFFANLSFRDTRQTALNKLKSSKQVEMTADETFLGRSGLNGFFRTRKKVGTLDGFLYFDWTETGRLKELNLQTEPRPADSYKTELEPAWKQFIELLGTLYGQPVVKGPIPSMASLADGSFVPSHFWKLATGGSALLGTAREGQKYEVVVRFTQKDSQVLGIP